MRSRAREDNSVSSFSTFSTLTTIYSRANESDDSHPNNFLSMRPSEIHDHPVRGWMKEIIHHWTADVHRYWIAGIDNRNRRLLIYLLCTCTAFAFKTRIPYFRSWIDSFDTSYEYTTIEIKDSLYVATSNPDFDAMQQPMGYPFHRWSEQRRHMNIGTSGYPLHTDKFVSILNKMGKGEKILTPLEQGLKYERSFRDFDRISGQGAQPYIVRNGEVLRPFGSYPRWNVYKWHFHGHHIDWVTLLESAVSMAKLLEDKNPRMKIITQGEFPIIFDEFDYPWCNNDLVPIFRLNGIVHEKKCAHQWPSLSLNYILPQRDQWLKDDPIAWDVQHSKFDDEYPWEEKLPKAVWRGRYTGYRAVYDRGILPREQLVLLASNHHIIMDIQPGKLHTTTYYKFSMRRIK